MPDSTSVVSPAARVGGRVKTGNRYPALDGLRAFAVLCVVFTHIGYQTGRTFHGTVGALLARLDFGVTVFFLLSGFLLYGPFVRDHLDGRRHLPVSSYLRNRALRILPAYWATLLVVLPVMTSAAGSPAEWVRHALLLQFTTPGHLLPGLSQMWSLCVEVGFYLLLPLLALLARRGADPLRSHLRVLVGMALVAVAWTPITRSTGVPDPHISGLWLPAYLDWFALGMGLAVLRAWHDRTGRFQVLDQVGDAAGTCWSLALLLFWLTTSPLGGPRGLDMPTPGQALTKHLLYGAAATFLVLPAVFGNDERSVARRLLEHPLARWLGGISYGVFLWHLLVLHLVFEVAGLEPFTGHFLLVTAMLLPASVLVAWLSLRVVEQPALARKRPWAAAR